MTRISSYPKEGMYFEQVRKRAMRISKNPKIDPLRKNQLVESLKNQSRLYDGEKAVTELQKEIDSKITLMDYNNHSKGKIGYSPGYEKNYNKIFENV